VTGTPYKPEVVSQTKGQAKNEENIGLGAQFTLRGASVFALDNDDSIVRWRSIVGVITAPAADNPVGTIHGEGSVVLRSGRASVDLVTGQPSFEVEGLVLHGGTASGTPGPFSAATGTLVCNAGMQTQTILDTAIVPLNVHGDAPCSGHLQNIPVTCANPVFLVRIAAPAGAASRWIATEPSVSSVTTEGKSTCYSQKRARSREPRLFPSLI